MYLFLSLHMNFGMLNHYQGSHGLLLLLLPCSTNLLRDVLGLIC